jgi:hypothetical protein
METNVLSIRRAFLLLPLTVCALSLTALPTDTISAVKDKKSRRTTQAWHIPTYKGIKLNKSTRKDVLRLFGKPTWSGHPEDEYDNPVMSMLRDEFENVGGFKGRTAVNMKKRNKIVDSIELYPPYDNQPTFDELAAQLGKDYVEWDGDLGPCPSRKEIREFQSRKKIYSTSLVFRSYPQKGFYVAVEHERVREIVYLTSCP